MDASRKVVASGVMGSGRLIVFPPRRDTGYYRYIPERERKHTCVLSVENPVLADASLSDGELTLKGDGGPIYVYHAPKPSASRVSVSAGSGDRRFVITKKSVR